MKLKPHYFFSLQKVLQLTIVRSRRIMNIGQNKGEEFGELGGHRASRWIAAWIRSLPASVAATGAVRSVRARAVDVVVSDEGGMGGATMGGVRNAMPISR
uniref:Uncharacterized protein n=1 Tax=Caenorhabditis japonica TaxID=281687 RepID=A0A8R1IPL5_CAEJA